MSNIANETTSKMKRNTAFVDLLKNVVNYTRAFGAQHGEKFVKAHPKDIFQEMMASGASGSFKPVNICALCSYCKVCDIRSGFHPQCVTCFRRNVTWMKAWSFETGQLHTFWGWAHIPSPSCGRCCFIRSESGEALSVLRAVILLRQTCVPGQAAPSARNRTWCETCLIRCSPQHWDPAVWEEITQHT